MSSGHRFELTNLNEPIQRKQLNDMLWYLFLKVQGGISERDIVGGVINTVRVSDPITELGLAEGSCVLYDGVLSCWKASQRGIGIYDGSSIIILGECELSDLYQGFNYYAQTDGLIGTDVTDFPVGYATQDDVLMVMANGDWGIPMQYLVDMVDFFATANDDGVRLRLNLDNDSDAVMVRYKTSAWTEGDNEATGTLVCELTDVTSYDGDNEWYKKTNLTDGIRYYFKAFPKKGIIYNNTIGVNEADCIAGGLHDEFTFDDINGTTVNNGAAGGDATAANMTYSGGKIGDQAIFNGSNGYMYFTKFTNEQIRSDWTMAFWFKPDVIDSFMLIYNNATSLKYSHTGSDTQVRFRNTGGEDFYSGSTFPTGTWHFFTITYRAFMKYV